MTSLRGTQPSPLEIEYRRSRVTVCGYIYRCFFREIRRPVTDPPRIVPFTRQSLTPDAAYRPTARHVFNFTVPET